MWHNVTQYGSNMSVEGFRWRGRSFQWVLIVFWCITSLWWSISRSVMKFCAATVFFFFLIGHSLVITKNVPLFVPFFDWPFRMTSFLDLLDFNLSLKEVMWKWKMFQMSALTATNLKNSLTPAARVSCDCVMLWGGTFSRSFSLISLQGSTLPHTVGLSDHPCLMMTNVISMWAASSRTTKS